MFHLITDGGCDFSQADAQQYNVNVVPFYVNFGDGFLKEGIDITKDEFFNKLLADKKLFPTTSQPNPQDYIDVAEPALKDGKDVAFLTISSKLSGSNNSANVAADILREDFPDRKVVVIDSLAGSVGQHLILKEIIKMRDAGLGLDEVQELAEKVIKTTHVYFSLDTLEYLKKGGRVGSTTALIGGVLGLRPILQLEEGMISQLDSVRGRKKVIKLLTDAVTHVLADVKDDVQLCIGHILDESSASGLQESLESSLGIKIENPIVNVGATIGAHAGPGAMAFAYCKKYTHV
jgi:DegV family protein with EDD domain